jgi:hypothetical protein
MTPEQQAAFGSDFDILRITDAFATDFLNTQKHVVAPVDRSGTMNVVVDADPDSMARTQLQVDGYMIEYPKGSGHFYLTGEGRSFISKGGYAGKEKEKQLLNAQITTAIASGKAAIETNDQIKKATWMIAIATVVNVIVATIPFIKNNDATLSNLQQSAQKSSQLIEEIAKYQRGMDSSLNKAVRDSFYQKRH